MVVLSLRNVSFLCSFSKPMAGPWQKGGNSIEEDALPKPQEVSSGPTVLLRADTAVVWAKLYVGASLKDRRTRSANISEDRHPVR